MNNFYSYIRGKDKPVIKKALVELDSHIFKVFEHYR